MIPAGWLAAALAAAGAPVAPLPVVPAPAAGPGVPAVVRGLALEYAQDGVRGDAAAIAASYAEACDAGEGLACAPERWRGQDLGSAAAAVFGPACDDGDPVGCLADGWAASQRSGRIDPAAPGIERAASRFTTACGLGVMRGCVELGTLYQLGAGVEARPERAVGQYERACAADEPTGCRRLAAMYHFGTVVPADPTRALGLYAQACDGGLAEGCNGVGLLLAPPAADPANPPADAPAPDPARAEAAWTRACDLGLPQGCGNLARVRESAGADPAEVQRLYRTACDGDVAAACLALAHAGLAAADPGAERDLGRACDLALPVACLELGVRQLRGDGVPAAIDAGESHLEAACAGGNVDGCATLAVAFDEGHFVEVDETAATHWYGRELDLPDACRIAADRARKGIGSARDPAAALALYQRACQLGQSAACRRAGH